MKYRWRNFETVIWKLKQLLIFALMKKLSAILFLALSVSSLPAQEKYTREAYIEKYWRVAVEEMRKSGIPASITLAQACLESDNGNSYLAVKGNNHFGIKCHGWTGKSIKWNDDERNECFRSYRNAVESFRDHSAFLQSGARYASLFELAPTDYEGWAYGLSEAGYATNPDYSRLLIDIIEKNNLSRFDAAGLDAGKMHSAAGNAVSLSDNGNVSYCFLLTGESVGAGGLRYVVTSGEESIRSIAVEYGLSNRELKRYNDLKIKSGKTLAPGIRIYLEAKKRKAGKNEASSHVVGENETLWGISQQYGIKLKRLCRMNHIEETDVLAVGDKLKLR